MATYTIELRKLVQAQFNVFDDSWSTFDPKHKPELISKILRRYWFYEIGQETPDRFKHYINEHLARIMPYYNKLYQSELFDLAPMYNMWLETDDTIDRNHMKGLTRVSRSDLNSLRQMADSLKQLEQGTANAIGNTNNTGTDHWQETTTGDKHEVYDEDTTEKTVEKEVFEENVATSENQVMEDKLVGEKSTHTTTDRNTTGTRRYSDTPQGIITSAGGLSIDAQYLTNYTAETGTEDITSDTTENLTNTENKTTDTTGKKDTTSTKDTTEDVTGTKNSTTDTDYSEKKEGDRRTTFNEDTTDDEKTTGKTDRFSQGSESTQTAQLSGQNENETLTESEKRGKIIKGTTVSRADLLQKYRDSIINIDNMIIAELANNFMGVF